MKLLVLILWFVKWWIHGIQSGISLSWTFSAENLYRLLYGRCALHRKYAVHKCSMAVWDAYTYIQISRIHCCSLERCDLIYCVLFTFSREIFFVIFLRMALLSAIADTENESDRASATLVIAWRTVHLCGWSLYSSFKNYQ